MYNTKKTKALDISRGQTRTFFRLVGCRVKEASWQRQGLLKRQKEDPWTLTKQTALVRWDLDTLI